MSIITTGFGSGTYNGTSSNDIFIGSNGDDTINGGGGFDIINYGGQPGYTGIGQPVTVAFGATPYSGTTSKYRSATNTDHDTFNGIAGVYGTVSADTLMGYAGSAAGLPYNIVLRGEGGNDTLDGAKSLVNLIDYLDAPTGVSVSLQTSTSGSDWLGTASDGFNGTDTLKNVVDVRGSNYDDLFRGSAVNDAVNGAAGLDVMYYSAASTAATWSRSGGSWVVSSPGEGADTLTSVEVLRFTDRDVVLDATRNDVSGDARGDLVWQNSNGAPSVWAMNGGQVSAYVNYSNPGASWRLVGTADLNGDGRADLLWQNADGTPSGWLVGGSGVAGYPVYSNPGASWRLVGGADVDGDGRADLLWQNANGAVSAWITAPGGTGVSAYVNFQNPGSSWRLVGGADLNGDGKSDLVFQNSDGTPAAWLMGGSLGAPIVSAYANFSNPGSSWSLIGTGDLNGDARDDLLFQNTSSGLPSAWLMAQDGMSVAGYPVFSNPGTSWHLRDATDANGDGRDDLVWQNDSGQPSLWIMGAGGTSVESYPVLNNPGASWHVV